MSRNYVASGPHRLAGSGVGTTDTSITLESLQFPDGTEITMSDFGDEGYATIDPRTSQKEFIKFTGITQDGTSDEATLTGVTRGLQFGTPYTQDTDLRKTHGGGSKLIFSNSPQFYDTFANKNNDETVSGDWTFSTNPSTSAGDPTDANDFARKDYVDNQSGGSTSKNRTVVSGNAGESVSAGDFLYFDESDQEWKKTDPTTASTVDVDTLLGIAQGSGTDGNSIANGILTYGLDANQSGLTAGTEYFLADTAGTIASSAGTTEVWVGVAESTTKLFFTPRQINFPSADEKDALVGTSGTPSSSNKYVTEGAYDVQEFSSSGTWAKPTGGSKVLVEVISAGGSGARRVASTANDYAPGGGGGGYGYLWVELSDLGATETVTIGSGGAAVTSGDTNGNDGGNSSFGSLLTMYGGKGGTSSGSEQVGAKGGSIVSDGFNSGAVYGISEGGGNGPGHGLYSGAGGAGNSNSADAPGGDTLYGGGGGGGVRGSSQTGAGGTSINNGDGGAAGATGGGNATAGTAPGGGGGGAVNGDSGAGADGFVRVTVFA